MSYNICLSSIQPIRNKTVDTHDKTVSVTHFDVHAIFNLILRPRLFTDEPFMINFEMIRLLSMT